MIKRFLGLICLFLTINLSAGIIINEEFKEDILNSELKNIPYIYNFDDLSKLIEKQYGYKLISKVYDLDTKNKELREEEDKIGVLLSNLLKNKAVSLEVDNDKGAILIKNTETFFIEFPYGWNFVDIQEHLAFNNKNLDFKISGNRLYVYGSKKEIKSIQPTLLEIEKVANTKKRFEIQIYAYNTKETDEKFIGYIKTSNYINTENKEYFVPEDRINTVLGHNDKYGFVYKNEFINLKLDLVKDIVIFDDEYFIPLSEIYELGYVFTTKLKDKNTEKAKKFIIVMKERKNIN